MLPPRAMSLDEVRAEVNRILSNVNPPTANDLVFMANTLELVIPLVTDDEWDFARGAD